MSDSDDRLVPTLVTTTAAVVTEKYLERGTTIGRYIVIDQLGEGGMGVVYRAFDPELDRLVALKLLQGRRVGSSSIGGSQWLLREAQALARLAHPNVVVVYDVGMVPGDQLFVAMELVDGKTLREWLGAERRSWRDVRRVMLDAGAGLAAVHAAGLVHRDFKPENVIIGSDGRVRVMDFGLARLRGDEEVAARTSDHKIEARSPLASELTAVDGVIGTPAYMAPEMFEGVAADARTDQFSFGVALFEALSGARPFTNVDLLPTRSTPKPVMPADAKVPARIANVALRAVSIDPAERFAAMPELLAELAADPAARRRRALVGLGAVALIAGVVIATRAMSTSHPCEGIDRRLAGIWDPVIQHKIHDAFAATNLPFAPVAFAALTRGLDRYSAEWTATAVESCEATRVRGDQTEEVLSLRQACLDQRLDELGALTRVLVEPNKGVVAKADSIAWELEPVSRCANVAALRAPGAPSPAIAGKLAEIDKQLADAEARLIAGQYLAALTAATGASATADAIAYGPAKAEAELLRGATLIAVGSHADAVTALSTAMWTAEAVKRDDVVARGAIALAMVTAEALGKPVEARQWIALGAAAAKRVGIVDGQFEIEHFKAEGIVEADIGDLPAAVAAQEKMFAAAERLYGHAAPVLVGDEGLFAGTLTRAFEYARAVPHFEHAIELQEQIIGPDHPDIALLLSNLAVCYQHVGDPRARATFERALAIREKAFGANSPVLVPTLDNYTVFLEQTGDIPRALVTIERAKQLAEIFPGKDHSNYHVVLTDYGETLVAAGRLADAHDVYNQALALELKNHSTALPTTQTSRAELALAEHAWPDAVGYADSAIAGFEAAGGTDNPELWRPLTDRGRAKLELGQAIAAKPDLERALVIGQRVHLTAAELAPTHDALARVH